MNLVLGITSVVLILVAGVLGGIVNRPSKGVAALIVVSLGLTACSFLTDWDAAPAIAIANVALVTYTSMKAGLKATTAQKWLWVTAGVMLAATIIRAFVL